MSQAVSSSDSRRPSEEVTSVLPIDDQSDGEFMALWEHLGSAIYYADNLERWPDKLIAVFRAIVDAPAGGIVFHCSSGAVDGSGRCVHTRTGWSGARRDRRQ